MRIANLRWIGSLSGSIITHRILRLNTRRGKQFMRDDAMFSSSFCASIAYDLGCAVHVRQI